MKKGKQISKIISAGIEKKEKRNNLGLGTKKDILKKNKKKINKEKKEKWKVTADVKQYQIKHIGLLKNEKKKKNSKNEQTLNKISENNKQKEMTTTSSKKEKYGTEKTVKGKQTLGKNVTDKPIKQIKTVINPEEQMKNKSSKYDASSKMKEGKTYNNNSKVKNFDELDFSCLDSFCKYKMRIKRKGQRQGQGQECGYEIKDAFKKVRKKELKQREKRREKEKLKEVPENIVNSSLFRYINEYMYKNKSEVVQKKLMESKSMFHIYHTGYKNQLNKWPNNPVEIIIKFLKNNFTENDKIADLGCGEAQIAQSLPNWNIVSFDLIKYNEYVSVGNITKLDIPNDSYICIILSLSLMNTDWPKIIYESSRCLKKNGILIIAEVASRFVKYKSFFKFMKSTKFKVLKTANLDDFFFLFFFRNNKKTGDLQQPMSEKKVRVISEILTPCLYKRR